MKSSVELFAISLYEKGFLQGNGDQINDLLEQAKAMHKAEIMEAYETGSDTYYDLNLPSNSEQYYKQTYGGNK